MVADLKTLKIDDRWSVKYDPNNNDRPTELLRYNESVGSVAHWNNPQVAMFYALLEKSQPAPAEAQTNFAAMIVGCNGLACQDGQILIDFGDEGKAAQAYDVLCAEVDATGNFKPSVLIDLERSSYRMLCEAAAKSNWIPPEYVSNDWVSDCANFLEHGAPDPRYVEDSQ